MSHVCRVYSITLPCLFLSSFYIAKQSHIAFLGNPPLSPSASTPPSKLPRTRFLRLKTQTNTSESPLSLDRQQHAFLSVSTSGVAAEVHGLGFSLIVSVRPEGRGNGCWHKRGVTGYSREATTEAAATTAEALTGRVPVKQKKGSKRLRSSPQPLKLARGFVVKEGRGGEQETAKREDGATRVNSGKRGNNSLLVCAFCQMMVGCCGVLLLPRELHPCFQLLPVL